MRFLPAGSDAFLVELDDLKATLRLLEGLRSARPDGVTELIPGARTVMIRFDPLVTDRVRLTELVGKVALSEQERRQGETFEVPVTYDGEDLGEVAKLLGWSQEEVIRRHTEATYTVAFSGFAPGFVYMVCDDPAFDVPRRKIPRVRVPTGSVAIAGKFAGIYPTDSPGGWQLLGRTLIRVWDPARAQAALLTPGDRVRFHDVAKGAASSPAALSLPGMCARPVDTASAGGLRVIRAERPAHYQDLGRPRQAEQGISESGALDRSAFREANLCVGNPPDTPAIEVTLGGVALHADQALTLAVTGAPCPLVIRPATGPEVPAPFARPFALDAGDELTLRTPMEGMRSYLALRGGFSVNPVIGSASTDTLAKLGPAPITAGVVLVPANRPTAAVDPDRPAPRRLPRARETVTLDVLLGPRTDWFTRRSVEALLAQDWQVTPESSRIGMRLCGTEPLQRRDTAELPSEGTVLGSIQVPHSGQPVLFLADHPLTGGYPVIGVVAAHHLDLAGQIPIGARIRFNCVAAFDPVVREASR